MKLPELEWRNETSGWEWRSWDWSLQEEKPGLNTKSIRVFSLLLSGQTYAYISDQGQQEVRLRNREMLA